MTMQDDIARRAREEIDPDYDPAACECDDDRVPGACWPMASDGDDSHPWVERCDDCKRYPDDEAAAEAVAAAVGRPVEHAELRGRMRPYVEASELPAALEAFKAAALQLERVWLDQDAETIDGYPENWHSFEETACQIAGMRVVPNRAAEPAER